MSVVYCPFPAAFRVMFLCNADSASHKQGSVVFQITGPCLLVAALSFILIIKPVSQSQFKFTFASEELCLRKCRCCF